MKSLFFSSLFMVIFVTTAFAQATIPDVINKDLVLRPSAKPYVSTGFTVEKNATLTLMSGVKINMSLKAGDKGYYPAIRIDGKLIVSGGAKPSVFIDGNPVIIVTDGEINITGLQANCMTLRLFKETIGTIKHSVFDAHSSGNENYNFEVTVPKKGTLVIEDSLFKGRGLKLHTSSFPDDLANFSITRCAFTTYLSRGKPAQYFLPITLFAYGEKCDSYLDVKFEAFNWEFKKPVSTEWFISNDHQRKMLEGSTKENKTFSIKLPNRALTKFKQDVPEPVKDTKK